MTIENLRKEENIWTAIIFNRLYKGVRFTYVKKYNREHKKNSHNINLIDQISGLGHILIVILNKLRK